MTRNPILNFTLPAWRSRVLIALFLLSFLGLIGRAVYLQGMHNEILQKRGESRSSRVVEMPAHRGMITDRHGEPLAISTPVKSLWANPAGVHATNSQLRKLAELAEVNVAEIRKKISNKKRDFVYLKRHLSPDVADKIVDLGIPGIFFDPEFKRYYPQREITAQMLGFTNVDDNGQEGIELGWQEILAGKAGSRRVIKDRKGRIVEDIEIILTPRPGKDLVLSLDSKIQYRAYRELKHAMDLNKAKAGEIVVLDPQTGEVLALVNLPAYNPNNKTGRSGGKSRNRVLTDIFEPGSTMKPFTVAAALEAGKIKPDTEFDTAPGFITIGRNTIRDSHVEGVLTVEQVIKKSSNVGTVQIALKLPAQTMWETFNRSGFGSYTGSGFPGEVKGKLRPYQKWRSIEQATMSYGMGISVNLLQLARAYTLFSAEGKLKPVSLLRVDKPPVGKQIISRKTALSVSKMLEMAVAKGGTATLAQIKGYRVAGKTGTAHKVKDGGGYARDKYISSFVGYAPASNPRLIIAVMLDEPSAGKYFGGQVAAPVFSRVMADSLRNLNVPHDAPIDKTVSSSLMLRLKGDV
ncbi:MAG: cell division protein [Nitrosomonadaceae bacterium]|nr:cell division protein [Nitrosomonadaceae bacterium]|tara:strand:+ start:1968 stop:3695 length:1728 start_codon:yes stop_codon:yes gene_type:complete